MGFKMGSVAPGDLHIYMNKGDSPLMMVPGGFHEAARVAPSEQGGGDDDPRRSGCVHWRFEAVRAPVSTREGGSPGGVMLECHPCVPAGQRPLRAASALRVGLYSRALSTGSARARGFLAGRPRVRHGRAGVD